MARLDRNAVAEFYLYTKDCVRKAGFEWEIDWQHDVSLNTLCESVFLREAAWVIFSAGFRESVLRKRFNLISDAFLYWESASSIWNGRKECRRNALSVFAHQQKVDAVIKLSRIIRESGFQFFKQEITRSGVKFLETLPFIGPITAFHLAKNVGIPCAKPDRHLVRLSKSLGAKSAGELCSVVCEVVGDPVQVVDVVFWRYCTLGPILAKRSM